jgi:hypothetical protein
VSAIRQPGRLLASVWWSPVRWLLPVALGLDLVLMSYGMGTWRGVWVRTFDWLGGDVILLGPLLAATAAWLAWRDRTRLAEVVASEPRRDRAAPRLALAGLVGGAWACHLAVLAVAAAVTFRVSGSPTDDSFVLAGRPLAGFALDAGLGYVTGLAVRSLAAPAVAASLVFTIPFLSLNGVLGARTLPTLVWEFGGGSGVPADVVPRLDVLAAQLALGGGVCLLATALAPRGGRPFRVVSTQVCVVGIVAIVAAYTFLVTTDDVAFTEPDRPLPVTCVGAQPQVCLDRADARAAPALLSALRRMRAVYARAQVPWPVTRVQEVYPGHYVAVAARTDPATRLLMAGPAFTPDGADVSLLVDQLAMPTACRGTDAYLRVGGLPATQATLDWLTAAALAVAPEQSGSELVQRLAAMPAPDRTRWLHANLGSLDRCDPDGMVPPP